jgi:hypothetical protein
MGTWGTGLYSDDLAADLRGDFRDLLGEGVPASVAVDRLMSEYAESLRREAGPRRVSQFLFQEPRTAKDQKRVVRTGVISKASQKPGGYTVFVWPYVDRLMREIFERD